MALNEIHNKLNQIRIEEETFVEEAKRFLVKITNMGSGYFSNFSVPPIEIGLFSNELIPIKIKYSESKKPIEFLFTPKMDAGEKYIEVKFFSVCEKIEYSGEGSWLWEDKDADNDTQITEVLKKLIERYTST